jgi:hypothetical protein
MQPYQDHDKFKTEQIPGKSRKAQEPSITVQERKTTSHILFFMTRSRDALFNALKHWFEEVLGLFAPCSFTFGTSRTHIKEIDR